MTFFRGILNLGGLILYLAFRRTRLSSSLTLSVSSWPLFLERDFDLGLDPAFGLEGLLEGLLEFSLTCLSGVLNFEEPKPARVKLVDLDLVLNFRSGDRA